MVRQLIRLRRSQAALEEMRYWLLCRLSQQPDVIGYTIINVVSGLPLNTLYVLLCYSVYTLNAQYQSINHSIGGLFGFVAEMLNFSYHAPQIQILIFGSF